MTKEASETLAELGFDISSKLSVPSNMELNMRLSVIPLGNVTVLICNGGQSEYDTLANHGAVKVNVDQKFAGVTPYLTVPTSRVFTIFRSIAMMRQLVNGATAESWGIANNAATRWIGALPHENSDFYQREVAANEFAESLSL